MRYRKTPDRPPACSQRLSFISKPLGKDREVTATRGQTPFTEGHRRRQVWVSFRKAIHLWTPQQLIPLREGSDTPPRARDRTTRGGDKRPRHGTHHTARPSLPSPRDQAAPPPPSPRLASSVSRRGISIDPRDMMATPLSSEPPSREHATAPLARTSPHKHRLTRTCSGQGRGKRGWLRPRGATSQSQRCTSLAGRLAPVREEEGGLWGWERAALLLRQRRPRGRPSASGEAGPGRATGSRQPRPRPRPSPRLERYVALCDLPCGCSQPSSVWWPFKT